MPVMAWQDELDLLDAYAEELNAWADHCSYFQKEEFIMDSINKVSVEGFIGCDPITHVFDDGNVVNHLSLGVCRYYKNDGNLERKISFIPVDVFNENEVVFKKGMELSISGFLKTDNWKDSDGNWRSKVKVVARNVLLRK